MADLDMANSLHKMVYVERESPFDIHKCIETENGEKVTRLRNLQRIVGTIAGTIKEYDPEEKHGKIEVEGSILSFESASQVDLSEYVGKEGQFTFWPTAVEISDCPTVNRVKISQIRKKDTPPSGYVEAIGKLERISAGSFVISVWSMAREKLFYVVFSGDYPKEYHLGRVVWVTGQFEPEHGRIYFREAKSVKFMSVKEAVKVIEEQKKKRGGSVQQQEVVTAMSSEEMWKVIMQEEVKRVTVNAKLKIVLKELPATIKDMGNMVWMPLHNEAKGVPGSMDLPEMPLELLVSKKMWNKTKSKADSIQQESGAPPVYVVEGLIGMKDGRLVTVASGIQVMAGKNKE